METPKDRIIDQEVEPLHRFSGVTDAELIEGEDLEDSALLKQALMQAKRYITGFSWCKGIVREYFGLGVGGVVSVFLFEVDSSASPEDGFLWVVSGDLPSAYLVPDDATNPQEALGIYIELMREWIEGVRGQRDLRECSPVNAEPSEANAASLERRLAYIEQSILPEFDE